MALNQAAAEAAVAAFESDAGVTYDAKTRTSITKLIKAIFDAIAANAEVLPNGSPAMAAGGDPVTGKGRIT